MVLRECISDPVQPESVRDHWDEITDFSQSTHPASIGVIVYTTTLVYAHA